MVGRRWSLVSVVSGAEDLLSRLIGMRLLSESRVTQRGSFLMRGGRSIPSTLGRWFLTLLFYTLNFIGSSSWVKPEPGLRWVEVFVMMTNIRVKHRDGKNPVTVDH